METNFISSWKAAGIGIISLVVLTIGIFGYAYLSEDDAIYQEYANEMEVFSENENETLAFYDDINTEPMVAMAKKIDNSIIPKWEENISIIEKTNSFEDLPQELRDQNKLLTEYAELRIETFKVFRKAIFDYSGRYDNQLDTLHIRIDEVLAKLN